MKGDRDHLQRRDGPGLVRHHAVQTVGDPAVDVAYRIPPGPYRERQQRQRDRDQETRQDAEPQPGTQGSERRLDTSQLCPRSTWLTHARSGVRAARGRSRGWRLYCVRKGGNPHRITCGGLAPALWRPTTDARLTPRAVRLERQAALGWRYWRSPAFRCRVSQLWQMVPGVSWRRQHGTSWTTR